MASLYGGYLDKENLPISYENAYRFIIRAQKHDANNIATRLMRALIERKVKDGKFKLSDFLNNTVTNEHVFILSNYGAEISRAEVCSLNRANLKSDFNVALLNGFIIQNYGFKIWSKVAQAIKEDDTVTQKSLDDFFSLVDQAEIEDGQIEFLRFKYASRLEKLAVLDGLAKFAHGRGYVVDKSLVANLSEKSDGLLKQAVAYENASINFLKGGMAESLGSHDSRIISKISKACK